jgi:four helix bundle protein
MFDFEQFPVYQKAENYHTQITKILSNYKIDKNLKDQCKRASLSIVLNIAEGAGKYAKNDKKNFYVIAKGSVNECVAILRILKLENNVTEETFQKTYSELLEIAKMLSALIKTMLKK